MNKKTIRDINVTGKKVLVRVDFNVPMDKNGTITDDTRIRATLPTIQYLLDHKARVILASHLGRPKGKVSESERLAPVAQRLSELLGKPVTALKDSIGPEVEAAVSKMKSGDVVLLENLRFHAEEEANDPEYAKALAHLADVYVNDAFGARHRAHASIVGITRYCPAVAGFLMEKELDALCGILEKPARPFASVIGGAKVSDKLGLLKNILPKVDVMLIGGGMAATFLKAEGYDIGTSMFEANQLDYVRQLMDQAKSTGVKLMLPPDVVAAEKLEPGVSTKVVTVDKIPSGWLIADIGPRATQEFIDALKQCRTVVWNGPMGVFEIPEFAEGTRKLSQALAEMDATTVIGGGSTAEAVTAMGLADEMTHVSTGGGASLELLEGIELPGVAALQDKAVPAKR